MITTGGYRYSRMRKAKGHQSKSRSKSRSKFFKKPRSKSRKAKGIKRKHRRTHRRTRRGGMLAELSFAGVNSNDNILGGNVAETNGYAVLPGKVGGQPEIHPYNLCKMA
jgi:transposase